MKNKFLLLTLVIAFISNGCSIDDDGPNFHFTALKIVEAKVPESFDLNKTYEISVDYLRPNNCTYYEGFDVAKDSLTVRNVVAVGAVRSDIDDCKEESIQETASFNFQVVYTDPYIFKFYTGNNSDGEAEYIEITVPVNKP
ncbi:hypothetical protein [Maribacter ulvicola]|nr:hypothetical protein [Maribacter ulvicola]